MIFLDVDEVLADWSGAALELLGIDAPPFYARWFAEAPAQWDMFGAPGFPVSRADAWARMDAAGAEYWAQIPLMPWARELLAACRALAPTCLLTRPSAHGHEHIAALVRRGPGRHSLRRAPRHQLRPSNGNEPRTP